VWHWKISINPKELRGKILEIGFLKKSKDEDLSGCVKTGTTWKRNLSIEKPSSRVFQKEKVKSSTSGSTKKNPKGGKDKYSYYYLIAKSFNEQEKMETLQYPCPEGGLHYVQESLTNIPRWARWVNDFTLKSWRKCAYLLSGLVLLLFTLGSIGLVLLLGLYTGISTVKWLILLFVSLWLGWLVISSSL